MNELFGNKQLAEKTKAIKTDEQVHLDLINTNNELMVSQHQLKAANQQISELTQRINMLRSSSKKQPEKPWLFIGAFVIAASCITFAITKAYLKSI